MCVRMQYAVAAFMCAVSCCAYLYSMLQRTITTMMAQVERKRERSERVMREKIDGAAR